MSITDELRTGGIYRFPSNRRVFTEEELTAIADRIDAEHESACAEAYGNGVMSVPIALDESQWVKLPVDADGVPIHVGDVIAYEDNTKPMEVVALVPPSVVMVEDGPRYADMCIHHHAPTVEDVLREMLDNLDLDPTSHVDTGAVVAEYAAKLRLAGDVG